MLFPKTYKNMVIVNVLSGFVAICQKYPKVCKIVGLWMGTFKLNFWLSLVHNVFIKIASIVRPLMKPMCFVLNYANKILVCKSLGWEQNMIIWLKLNHIVIKWSCYMTWPKVGPLANCQPLNVFDRGGIGRVATRRSLAHPPFLCSFWLFDLAPILVPEILCLYTTQWTYFALEP